MSRIVRIDLCDYRAFPGPAITEIHLRSDKRHLLLYGENGSGKSSLGRAIKDFFDLREKRPFSEFRNVFTETTFTGGHVKLIFDDPALPPLLWTMVAGRDGTHPLFAALSTTAAWIDYERLRGIYQIDRTTLLRDIFPLCREVLLADVPMPASQARFGREWDSILSVSKGPRGRGRTAGNKFNQLQERVTRYNTALAAFLPEWENEANKLIELFVKQTEVQLLFEHQGAVARAAGKWVVLPPRITLRLRYRGYTPGNPTGFLNEARLSACAIALWLAALLRSRPLLLGAADYPRVLVLDDVLLSLDMEHRRPMLKVLQEKFADWQVLLLTHNRVWYDIAKQRLSDKYWQFTELYAVRIGDYESPLVVEDEEHLYRALRYLEPNTTAGERLDVKAAAVHVRTKFELILKSSCERLSISVPFKRESKMLTLNSLWGCLAAHKEVLQHPPTIVTLPNGKQFIKAGKRDLLPIVSKNLAERILHALSWVLNPLSHSENVEVFRDEIFDAVFALDDLERVVNAAAIRRVLKIERAYPDLLNVLRARQQTLAVP